MDIDCFRYFRLQGYPVIVLMAEISFSNGTIVSRKRHPVEEREFFPRGIRFRCSRNNAILFVVRCHWLRKVCWWIVNILCTIGIGDHMRSVDSHFLRENRFNVFHRIECLAERDSLETGISIASCSSHESFMSVWRIRNAVSSNRPWFLVNYFVKVVCLPEIIYASL